MPDENELYAEFLGYLVEDNKPKGYFIIHGDHPKRGIPVDYQTLRADGIIVPTHKGAEEWIQGKLYTSSSL